MNKKVLIITYNWPPSGGINVLRCLKFAKYLYKLGWEPIIYTAKNAHYPYLDYSNEKDIPEGITILQGKIVEPFKLFKKITGRKKSNLNNIIHVKENKSIFDNFSIWIRGNFFIPDARSLWIKPSVKYLKKYIRDNRIDAFLTDGPPHTNTVIGCRLSKITGIPWLADFQDPWTQVDYYELFKIGKRADKKHKNLEQETFRVARKITIASPTWKEDLESIGAKNVSPIYYGYDEDDFKNLESIPNSKFTIAHFGLLGFDRNMENLFQVLKELKSELKNFSQNLEIKILGQIDFSVSEEIKLNDLEGNLNNIGTVSREIALQEMLNSWILLLPLNKAKNVKGRMPGKFYEYIRAKRPIVSFGPNDSDVANIINEFGVGENFEYSNTLELKSYIVNQYENFKKGNFEEIKPKKDISFFSNYTQVKRLSNYLNEITK